VAERTATRREVVWARPASVVLGALLAVAGYVAFLAAAGTGPVCPAVYPAPEGCEPDRGLHAVVAIGAPFGALLGASVSLLAVRRLPVGVRVALLALVVAAGGAATVWALALRS